MALTKISRSLLDTGVSDSSDATAITIDSSENVGIGNTSPSATLDVAGRFTVASNDGHSDTKISSTSNRAPRLYFLEGSTQRASIQSQAGIDQLAFFTGTSERMRIDSSGKLLIGDSASHVDDLLQIESPASGGGHGIQIRRNDSNTDPSIGRVMFGNNTDTDLATISAKTDGANDSGALLFATQTTGGASTERMRIHSGGCVSIGTDVNATNSFTRFAGSASKYSILMNNNYGGGTAMFAGNTAASGWIFSRFFTDGTQVGYISVGTSSTSYSTSGSDISLKENIEDWTENVLDKFKDIKPVTFNFISDENKETQKGYIAQNEAEKFPEAYPLDQSTDKYAFNPSGMVTYLMKAIQELSAKVEELESKINEWKSTLYSSM